VSPLRRTAGCVQRLIWLQYMGEEFKNKGVSVALGPVVGPLGKFARGGRNWEGKHIDKWSLEETSTSTANLATRQT